MRGGQCRLHTCLGACPAYLMLCNKYVQVHACHSPSDLGPEEFKVNLFDSTVQLRTETSTE